MSDESFTAARHGRRAATLVGWIGTICGVTAIGLWIAGVDGFETVAAEEVEATPVAATSVTAEEPPRRLKYGSRATRLYHARGYLRTHEAPDFWALMPYYVHQFTERSCSVASTAMVVNAARARNDLASTDELISQRALLRRVSHPRWHDAIQPGGDGVTIEDLGGYLDEALREFAPEKFHVEAVRIKTPDDALRERVREMLVENERSDDDFVIVFFWQETFTDDPEGKSGHVAPLGAYDEANERVLVLDPDRDWYEPYWVSLDVLVEGMARRDPDTGKSRGYLWVRKANEVATRDVAELE